MTIEAVSEQGSGGSTFRSHLPYRFRDFHDSSPVLKVNAGYSTFPPYKHKGTGMAVIFEEEIRNHTVRHVAERMLTAARTAPKARGVDTLAIALLEKDGIQIISDTLKDMVARHGAPAFFGRDAENILAADAMVIIGTRLRSLGMEPCQLCGFTNCEEKDRHPDIPCAFNTGDLGIAIGSAVSVAMEARVDNRIMYTVGQAALALKLLGEDVKVAYGIPLCVRAKNPFFDRK
jgi:uncharacterized ferredoxin-like protein